MLLTTLEILRCPFCGTRLNIVDNAALRRSGDAIESGVLGCECCAFPVVSGIPVMIASDMTRTAMHQLEAGDADGALHTLLDLEGERVDRFREFVGRGDAATYREGITVLSQDAEAEYFVYRLSDPTFRVARAVVTATGAGMQRPGRYLDLCGGSGHLTRSMISDQRATLADVYFWKLWLAKEFVAPQCEPICCDANHPLPFARGTFSLVVLSDAFPYIWHKRLLADEMMRLAGPAGTIVMPHLHSALGDNFTAGMPLTPAAYRDLLEPHQPRLFRDSALLDQVLAGYVDLSGGEAPETLAGEAALVIVASRDESVFRRSEIPFFLPAPDAVIVNPLYRTERRGDVTVLTRTFPTAEYEEEFAAAKRYLPESAVIPGDLKPLDPIALGPLYEQLVRNMVLVAAPPRYA
jgi:uncharacterized protein YbaR (Trm112 family)